jgi:hypothetical protein
MRPRKKYFARDVRIRRARAHSEVQAEADEITRLFSLAGVCLP